MKFLTECRFNIIDSTFIAVVVSYLGQGHYLLAVLFAALGATINSLVEHYGKNRLWQELLKAGQKVEAIRVHRTLFKSTLKDALEAVNAYEAKLKLRQ